MTSCGEVEKLAHDNLLLVAAVPMEDVIVVLPQPAIL